MSPVSRHSDLRSDRTVVRSYFERAVANGAPTILTRAESSAIDANRAAALSGQQRAPIGMSLDEYPFASSVEGGAGAYVGAVPVWEHSHQGGVISSFFKNNSIAPGDQFRVAFE